MNIEPRAALHRLTPIVHGALDFSTNTNAYGPSPAVRRAIANLPIARYPDRLSLSLRRSLASHLGIEQDRILVSNGSTELLWLIALAYLRPLDRALIIGPTMENIY